MGKIAFEGRLAVPHEQIVKNMAHAKSLGLPYISKAQPHGRRLAVVGGGSSIVAGLDELQRWDGDIWAVNGACRWLREHGVHSTFLSVDPLPVISKVAEGSTEALVCSRCDPSVFEVLKGKVTVFDLLQDNPEGGVWASCSTVLCTFDLATTLGYLEIVFFGCEGSFEETTHTYMDDPQTMRFVVSCGGEEYMTLPELYLGTLPLATILKTFPTHFSERSGGLLRAIINNEDHDIVKVSKALMAEVEEDRMRRAA